MHMADALLSPAVGGTMWAASAGVITFCCRRVKAELDDRKVPLMGVLGAFIFAVQMINFSIPGTGSSGHLGGALILAILLGPCAAFLTLASVLFVQALFFADGGLLALGSNVFNLGFFPCFIAYPLIYRRLAGERPGRRRVALAAIPAAVVGLQLGALAVVVQTVLSGLSDLSYASFLLLMQPIHLVIGLVEGIVTAAVVCFIWRNQPEVLAAGTSGRLPERAKVRGVAVGLALAAISIGGVLSWFASEQPDGLEWALAGSAEAQGGASKVPAVHETLQALQGRTAFLPDYGFRERPEGIDGGQKEGQGSRLPAEAGTTAAGLIGGLLTLLLAALVGGVLKRRKPAG